VHEGYVEPSRRVNIAVETTEATPTVRTISGEIPASAGGGLLAIIVELMQDDGHPLELSNMGSYFAAEATVAELPTAVQPALGPKGYPSAWQTWRLTVPAGSPVCPFSLRITDIPGKAPGASAEKNMTMAQRRYSAYFLPREACGE